MSYYELEQDKEIRKFLREFPEPTKDNIFILFHSHFIHPDIATEFTNKVVNNVIEVSYDYFISLPKTKRFYFLRAIGKLIDSALSLKMWEFQLSRDDASWYWKGTPTYFQALSHLIKPLEDLRRDIGVVKGYLHDKVVCVEGETEINFINSLYQTLRTVNFDFPVHNYNGKGNIQNLIQFSNEKKRQGVSVFVSYDKDGTSKSFIDKLKRQGSLEKEFGFSKDFESSFPPIIIKHALERYLIKYTKSKQKIHIDDIKGFFSQSKPFLKLFNEKYKIEINKVKFGKILGTIMADVVSRYWNNIFNEKLKSPFNFEIFKFMKFLIS